MRTSMEATQFKAPAAWHNVLVAVGLLKVVIAGAGVGIAALGVVELAPAAAASVKAAIAQSTHNDAMNVFAYAGAGIALLWKLASGVFRCRGHQGANHRPSWPRASGGT